MIREFLQTLHDYPGEALAVAVFILVFAVLNEVRHHMNRPYVRITHNKEPADPE